MIGVAAKFQDVPLRNPDVFEQLPQGVRQIVTARSESVGGNIAEGCLPVSVRALARQ